MLKTFFNDEHLKNAAQISVLAFFAAFAAEISRFLVDKNAISYYPQFHALMGAGIGSYFWSKHGKRGVVYAIAAATLFNIVWELFEAYALNWTPATLNTDTKIDIATVYISMLAGIGAEALRNKLNNANRSSRI
ncbi:MAG: hypothetical protein HYT16_04735 [DPANN group archaeon]|nr:hypothetical protein [DPANN group archaeon]